MGVKLDIRDNFLAMPLAATLRIAYLTAAYFKKDDFIATYNQSFCNEIDAIIKEAVESKKALYIHELEVDWGSEALEDTSSYYKNGIMRAIRILRKL